MPELVANGVRHHYQLIGAGERTVVFIHGLVMDNLSSWYFTVANRVAQSARVLLYDLRGHGRSQRPETGYTADDLVADLLGLLGALDLGRPVTLVGNSFGGLLAVAFAAAHPGRVDRMALVDAHYSAQGWGQQMAETLSLEGEDRDRMIVANFRNWLGRHSERKRSRLAAAARGLVHGTTLVGDLRRSGTLSDDQLRAIACPVLALYGEVSDALACGHHLERTLPDCTLRILAGCSHSVLWEQTAAVREQLAAWCNDSWERREK
jgi:pimeloyl-ACP methyl ester carboxylesterase